MSKKLAIKGHATRGKEVIELLEMIGGNSPVETFGLCENRCYSIKDNGWIVWNYIGPEEIDKYEIFTLEEFLEKYPFKVGDKVVYTKFGDNCDDYPVTIESMKWTGTTIEYTFNDCVTCLTKDLKMWEEEPKAVISGIYLNSCDYADEVELNLGDYEIEVRDSRTFAVKKKPKYPKYPTTYKECRAILDNYNICSISGYKAPLLISLQKLLVCLDAYWNIAGEEMGLDKPWKPDWLDGTTKYGIHVYQNIVIKDNFIRTNCMLAFPTVETRDIFYENFKDLIEECKELL